jgi:hypothetical protein
LDQLRKRRSLVFFGAGKQMAKRTQVESGQAAAQYLAQIGTRMEAIKAAVPEFARLGEKMAKGLLAGGDFSVPGVARYYPSEVSHRAGGMMGIRGGKTPENRNDVALFALPDARFWDAEKDEKLKELLDSPGQLFVVGREDELPARMRKRIHGFTGGALSSEGGHAIKGLKPLTGFRAFEHFVRGWITQGEMIAACTRGGKMPTMWMSVWLEGALARNSAFVEHDNLREPWSTPFFHRKIYIPPLAPGYVAGEFLDAASKIHRRLAAQTALLGRAGEWMASAYRAKRKVHIVAVGHSYPEILELKNVKNYPIEWGRSMSDLNKAVPPSIGKGEVALHFGYSPVDVADVKKILDRGVKFIYSSPFGRPANLKDHENLIWFDMPWRPADATVDVPGYSVRLLPMSSTSHSMAYNAVLSEFAEQMGWH